MIQFVVVTLDCKHQVETPEQTDWLTPVRCWRCNTSRHVVSVWEFCRVKCLTCRSYKGYRNKATAEKAAYKHGREYPLHMVQCYQRGKLLFTTTQVKTQGELPLFQPEPLPPPF